MDLATATWTDLATAPCEVVLIPTGSCEQHGPHLPFVTDALVAEQVARRAAVRLGVDGVRAVVAPVLAYGASGEHQHFPGTLSIGHDALRLVLVELGRSAATWAQRLVFVNGHGGNLPTVRAAVEQLRYEGRDAAFLPCEPVDADAHAGHTETSLMSVLAPAAVRWDDAEPGVTDDVEQLMPRLVAGGVIAVSPNGVLGDPTTASPEDGEELLDGLVELAVRCIRHGLPDESGRLRDTVEAAS